jgi:aspartyl-tRNA(Asn)/glutamyl-tRNA(Gln) amidotransferase subunit C
MAKLSRDDILKLARLSRLELTEEEITQFAAEITSILEYVDQLQQVDITGLKPTSQVTGLTNVMREDVVRNYGVSREQLLQNVPAVEKGQIKVRRMVI